MGSCVLPCSRGACLCCRSTPLRTVPVGGADRHPITHLAFALARSWGSSNCAASRSAPREHRDGLFRPVVATPRWLALVMASSAGEDSSPIDPKQRNEAGEHHYLKRDASRRSQRALHDRSEVLLGG